MTKRVQALWVALWAIAAIGSGAEAQPSISFYGTSFDVVTNFSTGATSDGRTVVGYSRTIDGEFGYRWDKAAGKQWLEIGTAGHGFVTSEVSDGLTVVGYRQGGLQASMWTPEGGLTTVAGSAPNSQARGITRDGRYIVGWQQDAEGMRRGRLWDANGVVLGDSAWIGSSSEVSDVSDDGGTTAGLAFIDSRQEAFRRTASGEVERLGFLHPENPTRSSRAVAISGDGRVIVGVDYTNFVNAGFRWTEDEGLVALPSDARGYPMQPFGVSGDGSLIVGITTNPDAFDARGVIWTRDGGVQEIKSYLLSIGLAVDEYNFRAVRTVSADGMTIAGVADKIGGPTNFGFVATIPAPGALPLLALGSIAIRRRR